MGTAGLPDKTSGKFHSVERMLDKTAKITLLT